MKGKDFPNKDLAKLLYVEVNHQTLSRVRALKFRLKKRKFFHANGSNAYIPLNFSNSLQISFKDLKH